MTQLERELKKLKLEAIIFTSLAQQKIRHRRREV